MPHPARMTLPHTSTRDVWPAIPTHTEVHADDDPRQQSSDARWLTFAGVYLMIAGALNLIWGITALAKKDYFHEEGLVFSSLQFWGWIAILIAAVQISSARSSTCAGWSPR